MKITFSLFLKYWFLLTCLVNWICIYIWLILILWLFLFVQLSNHPPIINTYLNISICLCSIRSKRLSCMNVESCFWKYLNFILYVLNVLWTKWNKKIYIYIYIFKLSEHDFRGLHLHNLKFLSTIWLYNRRTWLSLHLYNLILGFYTCTAWNFYLFGKVTYFTLHSHTLIFITFAKYDSCGFFILVVCMFSYTYIFRTCIYV